MTKEENKKLKINRSDKKIIRQQIEDKRDIKKTENKALERDYNKKQKVIKKQEKKNYIENNGRLKYLWNKNKGVQVAKGATRKAVLNSAPVRAVQQAGLAIEQKAQNAKETLGNIRDGIKESGSLKKYVGKGIKDKALNSKPVAKARKIGKGAVGVAKGAKKAVDSARNLPKNIKNTRDNIKKTTGNIKNKTKNTISNIRKNGLKNSAKGFGKKITSGAKNKFNKLMNSNRMLQMKTKLLKIGAFVVKFKTPILITTGIVIVLIAVVPTVLSVLSEFGETPHYYCAINASKETKQSEIYRRYCSNGFSGGNDTIVQAALSCMEDAPGLIWPDKVKQDAASGYYKIYKDVYDNTRTSLTAGHYDNCTGFTAAMIRWCLTDNWAVWNPDSYISSASSPLDENWLLVTDFESNHGRGIDSVEDMLEPGDLLMSTYNSGGTSHIFLWLGSEAIQEKYPEVPSEYKCISAGYDSYMPIFTTPYIETCSHPHWYVYRWIGEPNTPYLDYVPVV